MKLKGKREKDSFGREYYRGTVYFNPERESNSGFELSAFINKKVPRSSGGGAWLNSGFGFNDFIIPLKEKKRR